MWYAELLTMSIKPNQHLAKISLIVTTLWRNEYINEAAPNLEIHFKKEANS